MSAILSATNAHSHSRSSTGSGLPQRCKKNMVGLSPNQIEVLEQIKKHITGPWGYGRQRVPSRFYSLINNGPNTFAVLKCAVAMNNPTVLSQELLEFFDSATGYHRAVQFGSAKRLTAGLVESLKTHHDPPMFIVQTLIGVGEMVQILQLDHDFELVASQFLIDVFQSLLGRNISVNSNNLQISTNTNSAPTSSVTQRKEGADPIVWDDSDPLDRTTHSPSSIDESWLLNFGDSPICSSLDASRKPTNKAKAFGVPSNRIDGNNDSNSDVSLFNLDGSPPSSTATASPQGGSHLIASPTTPTPTYLINEHLSHSIKTVDSFEKNKKRYHPVEFIGQEPMASQPSHSIQPRHQQKLLNEIMAHKSSLQVFVAIEAFELQTMLRTPIVGINQNSDVLDKNASYGSLLALQLIEHGYLDAATTMTTRSLIDRNHAVDTMLLARLVQRNKLEMIYTIIGDNMDLYRSALQLIERHMAGQIWKWIEEGIIVSGQLNHYHSVQCMKEGTRTATTTNAATSSNDILDSVTPSTLLTGMVGIATNLAIRFEVDDATLAKFRSIKLVTDFCTVVSLLWQEPTTPSNPPAVSQSNPIPSIDDPLSAFSDSEYQLHRPWRFLPVVLSILGSNVALQRLVIWYGARSQHGSSATGYLASKLGQQSYYDQCLEKAQTRRFAKAPQTKQSLNQHHDKNPEKETNETFPSPTAVRPLAVIESESASEGKETRSDRQSSPIVAHSTYPALQFSSSSTTPPPKTVPSIDQYIDSGVSLSPLSSHFTSKHAQPTPKNNPMMSWNPYKLPPTTNIFEINHPSQLTQLACSIFQSTVVGMSLLRPLERPWAHCVEAESELKRQGDLVQDAAGVWGFNGQSTATRQKEGDTHGGATVVWGFKNSSPATRQQGGGDGYEGAECAGGEGGEINARFKVAFLQLACNHDDRVYVIELEPFLNDPDHTLPKLLSEVFSNRRICKLVYNWSNENAFLISLFSLLEHQRCPRKNIIDLHYIWFVQESQNQIAKGPATNTFDSSSSSSSSSASNSSSDQGARHFNPKAPRVYTPALKVVAWTTDKPLHPTAMLRPGHPTVSGLLHRLTGKVLKRVSSLTWDQWKVRPLQPSLRVDAALSTQCLFDIFEALNNGQRIDQHATAAFKTTFR